MAAALDSYNSNDDFEDCGMRRILVSVLKHLQREEPQAQVFNSQLKSWFKNLRLP